jgi:NAD(P)-dependent dehydrogenase (short-subunit alcohol dehydrogenase family)
VQQAREAGVEHIDIVIANAGMSPPPVALDGVSVSDISEAIEVNTISPIALYKATELLLKRSSRPRWLSVSSAAGSIANLKEYSAHYILAYGMSKAALNFFTVALHASPANIVAYAIHPGLVMHVYFAKIPSV